MNEEQFVNIDLNDDYICGICKMETAKDMLSFCHVCFELSIEGVPRCGLLHTESVRGHRECFEKCHLIASQDLPRSRSTKTTYRDVKEILSRKIGQIIHYAQNHHPDPDLHGRRPAQVTGGDPEPTCLRTHFHQANGSQLPRYSPRWLEVGAPAYSECTHGLLVRERRSGIGLDVLGAHAGGEARWSREDQLPMGNPGEARCHPHYTRDHLSGMAMGELVMLNDQLLKQIKVVFEDLTAELEKKDSLSSELHVRYIAIEQLFKNSSKLPWLQIGRRGIKPSVPLDN
ncbi:protein EURL homolog isoform X2 [Rhinoraja longicauda]